MHERVGDVGYDEVDHRFPWFLFIIILMSRSSRVMYCEHSTVGVEQLLSLTAIAFKYNTTIAELSEYWINCHQFKCKLK